MMPDFEILLHGIAIGIATAFVINHWVDRPFAPFSWTVAGFCLGITAYLIWGLPGSPDLPLIIRILLALLAIGTPWFFWLFTVQLFIDDFQLRARHFVGLAAILICATGFSILVFLNAPPLIIQVSGIAHRLIALGFLIHALLIIWQSSSIELVEARARLRGGLLFGAGVMATLIILAAIFYLPAPERPQSVRLAEVGLILMLMLSITPLMFRADDNLFPIRPHTAPGAAPTPPQAPELDGEDRLALSRLDRLMREEEIWRGTGLTIGSLAVKIGLPEYRLRRLINSQLGYRNFNSFLNDHRLPAAAAALTDRTQLKTPILTLALELGYGSIGPFNRAFRDRYGMTPTDYRRDNSGK